MASIEAQRCLAAQALREVHRWLGGRMTDARVALLLRSVLVCTLSFCACSVPVHAAQVITLEDAIGIALERNVPLLQARNAAQLSDVAVSEATLRFLPDLSVGSTVTRCYGRYCGLRNSTQTTPIAASTLADRTESLTMGISSGVTLFAGLHDVAALRQASMNRRASRLDLGRDEETTVYTVVANFLALVQDQDQTQVRRENLSAEAALEEQIRTYVRVGTRASADLYQQQANVARARLSVIQAENAAELSKIELMRTLQLDPVQTYDFQAGTLESVFSTDAPELKDLVDRALARRTDLQAEEARVGALEHGVQVARSGYWPTVSLTAGFDSSYDDNLAGGVNHQLDASAYKTVSLNVSVPIFDRGATRSAVRRAELDVQNQRIALNGKRKEIELQIKTVYVDYQAAREQLRAAELQQQTAQLAVQSAQERFKAGTAILVEVSQQRTSYVLAQTALVSARYNLASQSTLVQYFLGEIRFLKNVGWQSNPPVAR